jgi:AcrR family transcriptional regulator
MPAAGSLSLEKVVEEASRLIREEGFDALTMRRLAARCGVTAMSLYRHVQTKEELLVILANRLLDDLDVPEGDGQDWRTEVAGVSSAAYRMWLAHPEFAQIIATQPIDGKVAYRWMERVFSALKRAGLSNRQVVGAYDTLVSYTAGFNQQHTGHLSSAVTATSRMAKLRDLELEEFPCVVELAELLTSRDAARDFEEGLHIVIDGIAEQVKQSPHGQ